MGYDTVTFEKRIKDNIKNYAVKNLYSTEYLTEYLRTIGCEYGMNILLTDRHGEKAVEIGDFTGFEPDVVRQPGLKLRVQNRTVGHLYVSYDGVASERRESAEKMFNLSVRLLETLGSEVYMHRESAAYIDELELKLESEHVHNKYGEKEDILTGVFNKNYLSSRMEFLDSSETVPVAIINVNINDWKFVYDNFGVEKSDSLIQLIASILMKEAKDGYIIGRIDGDVFLVLIPLAGDGEAEDYGRRVQEACLAYEDDVLAPSAAVGIVYKSNVEERIQDRISDAEYEMFNNKMKIKGAPGYQERLRRGVNV